MLRCAALLVAAAHAGPIETVQQAIAMLYPQCIRRGCSDKLMMCNQKEGVCAERLRCALTHSAQMQEGYDMSTCYKTVNWKDLSNEEVAIMDCAKREDCVHGSPQGDALPHAQPGANEFLAVKRDTGQAPVLIPGRDSDFNDDGPIPSSLLETYAKLVDREKKARNMVDEESDEKLQDDETKAAEELTDALNAYGGKRFAAVMPLVTEMAHHGAYMHGVTSLLQTGESLMEDLEAGKDDEATHAKLYTTLGALEAAMDSLGGHIGHLDQKIADKEHGGYAVRPEPMMKFMPKDPEHGEQLLPAQLRADNILKARLAKPPMARGEWLAK